MRIKVDEDLPTMVVQTLQDKGYEVSGVVEQGIVVGLTQKAHALCYPSLYEGFGFPPLEAMSLGVPVLAGNSSSIPEITADAACLVDPTNVDDIAQGLNRIIFDSDYRHMLIEAGYRQITKFSWQKAAAEYLSILQLRWMVSGYSADGEDVGRIFWYQ